jgi:thermitase
MTKRFGAVVALLIFSASPAIRAQEKIPNDPHYKDQVSFHNPGGKIRINTRSYRPSLEEFDAVRGIDLNIEKAWAITTGSKSVVVALLDDGFCYNLPDVRDNIWHNPRETGTDQNGFAKETNELDDDHNGYIDDVVGWNFAFDSPDPDCHVFDGMDKTRIAIDWHSSSAMGIIGAKGNNGIGVAGINWDVSMMLLQIGAQGTARGEIDTKRIDRAVKAIHYAADNGARIINWSGFVDDTRPEKLAELQSAFQYAATKNVLIVVAAGNSFDDLDQDQNCKAPPECFEGANLLKVAEIDFRGELYRARPNTKWVGGSNYGAKRVDIAAIAMNYTTFVKNGVAVYGLFSGTSNAAPVVSGVAALMLSVNPKLTTPQMKQLLLQTATKLPGLKGKAVSEGMVNAYEAVLAAKATLSSSAN